MHEAKGLMIMAGDSTKKGFSGLSELVSDVNDIDEPIIPKPIPKAETKPSTPQQSPQPQPAATASKPERDTTNSPQPVKVTNSAKKNEGTIGKWIVIFLLIAVISFVMTSLISKDRQQSHKRYSASSPPSSQTHKAPQSSSVPSAKAPNSTKSAGLQYTKPSVGTNNLLSTPEIRWCVRESIRIDAMRNVVETNTGIDDFNRIVNDYNSRCGNYRYRQGSQAQAERDVEPNRSQIVSEAVHEAKRMNQLGSYNAAPESTSLAQRHSVEEQQSNSAPNKSFETKEPPAPLFNMSDLDCQRSPVTCKDQAKRPVSGVVLTFDDNSLKKAATFLNGSSNGPTISFHQNGGINWITNFKNGRMDGPSIQFYENPSGTIGSIKWIIPFSNGLAEGIRRGYYETGELKSETSYTRGKENGFLYEFYKNGYLKSTEQYIEGEIIGEKKTFSPNTQRKDHVQPRPSELSAIEDLERQALKLLDQLTTQAPVASGSSTANVPSESSAQYIRDAQQLLTDLGYSPGPVDGEYGSQTADAVKTFNVT
ncbi:peptidoglycan-binding protein [Deltaproteobacteria bacterium OttesenSCG-928-M10]|nr:peptidoglycan-binding protein [Deltaproteobacteria bacterium OttesenSCG-928-M10]